MKKHEQACASRLEWVEKSVCISVMCDERVMVRMKGVVCNTVVRPAMFYGLETEEKTGGGVGGSRS